MVELSFELIYSDEPDPTTAEAADTARLGLHPHGG